MGLPAGLAYDVAGHVVPGPDAGVQQALRHLFAVFARTGSARAVVAAFQAEKLLFPVRITTGPRKTPQGLCCQIGLCRQAGSGFS